MAKFETAEAAARLEKVRELIRKQDMTVAEVAHALDWSAQLTTHYVRRLRDLEEIKEVGRVSSGMFDTPTKVWGWAVKPKPAKRAKATTIKPPRRDMATLTHWMGGNPFERLTKCGA